MIGQSTGFGFDSESATLEARVWLAGAAASTPLGIAAVKQKMESRLQSILQSAVPPLPRTNISLAGSGTGIVLSGAMPLDSLTFSEMLFSLRKLERLAGRLTGMLGPAHAPLLAVELMEAGHGYGR